MSRDVPKQGTRAVWLVPFITVHVLRLDEGESCRIVLGRNTTTGIRDCTISRAIATVHAQRVASTVDNVLKVMACIRGSIRMTEFI